MPRIIGILNRPVLFFKRQSRKKKITIIIILLVGIIAINSIFFSKKQNQYNLEPVTRADIVELVDESGVVKISGQTDIYSPTNGIIEEIYVNNGSYVEEGQELFKVKSTATQQEQQSAYANYLSAVTALNTAQSTLPALQADMFAKWDTFKELAESDDYENEDGTPDYQNRARPEFHIPEKQWLSAEQKYKDQQQVIAQAQVAVNSAWLQYQATQTTIVKSTANGVVANLSISLNDSVMASAGSSNGAVLGLTTATARPILTVADYSVYGVLISLNETDINKVKPGAEAIIDIDPIDNRRYEGRVSRVDELGYEDEGIMKYDVFIVLYDKDQQVKSGMTADAEIITNKLSNVLSVPNSAVKPYQGGRAVQVVNAQGELEFIPVVIGIRGENRTQIVKGLSEGQMIVTALSNDQIESGGFTGF